jgi:hypothetical protein
MVKYQFLLNPKNKDHIKTIEYLCVTYDENLPYIEILPDKDQIIDNMIWFKDGHVMVEGWQNIVNEFQGVPIEPEPVVKKSMSEYIAEQQALDKEEIFGDENDIRKRLELYSRNADKAL